MAFAHFLLDASVAGLGVFLGANLAEAALLVPFWRSLDAPAFYAWYAANDQRLLGFFAPLTTACALLLLLATAVALAVGHPGRWAAVVALLLVIGAAAMFPLYFRGANARFSAAAIAAADLPGALAAWAAWHHVRIAVVSAALAAALWAALA